MGENICIWIIMMTEESTLLNIINKEMHMKTIQTYFDLQVIKIQYINNIQHWQQDKEKVSVIHYKGEGNGTPLQYSCLENPMDGGAWKAAVHGVAEGRT